MLFFQPKLGPRTWNIVSLAFAIPQHLDEMGWSFPLFTTWSRDDGLARCEKRKCPEDLDWRKSSPIEYKKMVDDTPLYIPIPSKQKNVKPNKSNSSKLPFTEALCMDTPDAKQSLITEDWGKV